MIDNEKIDNYTLALLHLVLHGDKASTRAWKGFDWETMDRLYEKGFISNPGTKAKSVMATAEGEEKMAALFKQYFTD